MANIWSRTKLASTVRYLARNHIYKTAVALPAVTAAAAGDFFVWGLLVEASSAVPMALIMTGLIGGLLSINYDMERANLWNINNKLTLNGYTLVGSKRDLKRVYSVQAHINRLTEDKKHLGVLPAALQRKIAAHMRDAAKALSRIQAYKGDEPQQNFLFGRDVILNGQEASQTFAPQRTLTSILPAPPKQKLLPAAVSDFAGAAAGIERAPDNDNDNDQAARISPARS